MDSTSNERFRSPTRSIRNSQPANMPSGYNSTDGWWEARGGTTLRQARGCDRDQLLRNAEMTPTNFRLEGGRSRIRHGPSWASTEGRERVWLSKWCTPRLHIVITRLARQFAKVENRDLCEAWQEEMRLNFQSKNGVKVGMVVQQ